MSDFAEILEQSLKECGFIADSVSHESTDSEQFQHFYITKKIAGEIHSRTFTVSNDMTVVEPIEKIIARKAEIISQEFIEEMNEEILIEDRQIVVSPYDRPSASCGRCGTHIELDKQDTIAAFSEVAEMSMPQPSPRTFKERVGSLSSNEREMMKLYLIGQLRSKCVKNCSNASTETFKYV